MVIDVFNLIQNLRKTLIKWLGILSPAIVAFIVFIFNLDIVQFLLQPFPDLALKLQQNFRISLTLNTVLLTVVFNIIIAIFKYPGEIKVKILNNSRKNSSQFNGFTTHHPIVLHVDGIIEFKSIIIKIIFLKFIDFKLKLKFPECIDPTLDSKHSDKFLLEKDKREFHIVVKNIFAGTNKMKKEFYIKYGIINNSDENTNEDINVTLATTLLPTIFLALFFDIKFEDYNIEITEY